MPNTTIDLNIHRDQALRSKADAETILTLCDGANALNEMFVRSEAEVTRLKAENAVLLARVAELLPKDDKKPPTSVK